MEPKGPDRPLSADVNGGGLARGTNVWAEGAMVSIGRALVVRKSQGVFASFASSPLLSSAACKSRVI